MCWCTRCGRKMRPPSHASCSVPPLRVPFNCLRSTAICSMAYKKHLLQIANIAARKRLKASGARTSLLTCSTKSGPARSAAGLHSNRQQGQLIATRALTEPAVQGVHCQGPKLNGSAPLTSSAQLLQRPSCTSNSCNNLVRYSKLHNLPLPALPWLQLQEA